MAPLSSLSLPPAPLKTMPLPAADEGRVLVDHRTAARHHGSARRPSTQDQERTATQDVGAGRECARTNFKGLATAYEVAGNM
jgi:hypothetical protein